MPPARRDPYRRRQTAPPRGAGLVRAGAAANRWRRGLAPARAGGGCLPVPSVFGLALLAVLRRHENHPRAHIPRRGLLGVLENLDLHCTPPVCPPAVSSASELSAAS